MLSHSEPFLAAAEDLISGSRGMQTGRAKLQAVSGLHRLLREDLHRRRQHAPGGLHGILQCLCFRAKKRVYIYATPPPMDPPICGLKGLFVRGFELRDV